MTEKMLRRGQDRRRRLCFALALLAVGALSACATEKLLFMDREQLGAALIARGLDPSRVVLPYAANDEMRDWAVEVVGKSALPEDKLIRIQQGLLDPRQVPVQYEWGYTGTASEVFVTRRANCLAFTNLFVAMARTVGVPVYFLAVGDVENFRREGDLVVVSDHIAVGYGGDSGNQRIFDFSEDPPADYHSFRKISDLTAIAMFHSNRGAEALQAGFVENAIEWLEIAVKIDPDMANAWVNLGVALRRHDQLDAAEEAYRKALALDPGVYSAYQNLASLLRMRNRVQEAMAYEETLAKRPYRNPYTYLSLGDISLLGGRFNEAEKLYHKSLRLEAQNAEAYAALGQLAVARKELGKARKMLRKAENIDAENPRVRRLASHLRRSGS